MKKKYIQTFLGMNLCYIMAFWIAKAWPEYKFSFQFKADKKTVVPGGRDLLISSYKIAHTLHYVLKVK